MFRISKDLGRLVIFAAVIFPISAIVLFIFPSIVMLGITGCLGSLVVTILGYLGYELSTGRMLLRVDKICMGDVRLGGILDKHAIKLLEDTEENREATLAEIKSRDIQAYRYMRARIKELSGVESDKVFQSACIEELSKGYEEADEEFDSENARTDFYIDSSDPKWREVEKKLSSMNPREFCFFLIKLPAASRNWILDHLQDADGLPLSPELRESFKELTGNLSHLRHTDDAVLHDILADADRKSSEVGYGEHLRKCTEEPLKYEPPETEEGKPVAYVNDERIVLENVVFDDVNERESHPDVDNKSNNDG